ncbi:MAG: DUF6412 domain-containing protein [Microbacterium sp.]
MFETLHTLLSLLGLYGGVDAGAFGGLTGALALTVALVTATVVLLAVAALAHSAPDGATPPHPRRAIDISSPLLQSDPDAPGHPRPRAPQSAASAA